VRLPEPLTEFLCFCPRCGSVMQLVDPGPYDDWESFYGCLDFPVCKGTRQIQDNRHGNKGEPSNERKYKDKDGKTFTDYEYWFERL